MKTMNWSATLLAGAICASLLGEDRYWAEEGECYIEPPTVGSFFEIGNWFLYEPPGAGDRVILGSGLGGPATIHFGAFCEFTDFCGQRDDPLGHAVTAGLVVQDGVYTLDMGSGSHGGCPLPPPGAGSYALTGENSVVVGTLVDATGLPGADAQLRVRNGTMTIASARVGDVAGTVGILAADGAGAIHATSFLDVGAAGLAELQALDGEITAAGPVLVGLGAEFARLWTAGRAGRVDCADVLFIGYQTPADAFVQWGGELTTHSAIIGGFPGIAFGCMNLDNGGLWTNYEGGWGGISVGWQSNGTIFVRTGGVLDHTPTAAPIEVGVAAGIRGDLIVENPGSTLVSGSAINAGISGEGYVLFADGGLVWCASAAAGLNPGGYGEFAISGAGTSVTVGDGNLIVGDQGTGALSLTDGAVYSHLSSSAPAVIGNRNHGTFFMSGSATVFDSAQNQLQVGNEAGGLGLIFIEGGTILTDGTSSPSDSAAILGADPGSIGVVELDGAVAPVLWQCTNGGMNVGFQGSGELHMVNGAQLESAGGYIGRYPGSVGTMVMDGTGTAWTSTGPVAVGAEGVGRLWVDAGATLVGPVTVGALGELRGSSTIAGAVENHGRVAPGLALGGDPEAPAITPLFIEGDYVQGIDGRLEIELAGLVGFEQYDVLMVNGTATLAGTLVLDNVYGFLPEDGDTFDVLYAKEIVGAFDEIPGYTITYDGGVVRVTAGTGEIGFDPPLQIGAINDPGAVGAVDFDGVNGNDIAVPVQAALPADPGVVVLFLNDGTGTGFTRVETSVGVEPSGIALGDFDGVNGPDAAVSNAGDNTVTILLNDGAGEGTFLPAQTVDVGNLPSSIDSGDIDGDGDIDLVVTNKQDASVTVLRNDGLGTFTADPVPVPVGPGPASVRLADVLDFPGPGSGLDMVVSSETGDAVEIYDNDGAGGYAKAASLPVGGQPGLIDPEDLDNDKDTDIVTGNGADGTVSTLISDGLGSFDRVDYFVGDAITSVDAVDLDADGDKDLLVVSDLTMPSGGVIRAVRVLRNEFSDVGKLEFTLVADLAPGQGLLFALASPLDGDLRPDVIVASDTADGGKGEVQVVLNTSSAVAGDVNGDGVVDIVDLLSILSGWGACPPPPLSCPEDLDRDGNVGVGDLLIVLGGWS